MLQRRNLRLCLRQGQVPGSEIKDTPEEVNLKFAALKKNIETTIFDDSNDDQRPCHNNYMH